MSEPENFKKSDLSHASGDTAPSRRSPWVQRATFLALGFGVAGLLGSLVMMPMRLNSPHTNEVAAMMAVRAIVQSQAIYKNTYPESGYACSLSALGGDPKSGPPTRAAAQMIHDNIANGHYDGYLLTVTHCRYQQRDGVGPIIGFEVTAAPQIKEEAGSRGICSDETGNLKADPKGGTNCTESLVP